jgi:hypothetical protein
MEITTVLERLGRSLSMGAILADRSQTGDPITRRPDGWPQSVSRSVADVSTRHRRAGPFCVAFFNAIP